MKVFYWSRVAAGEKVRPKFYYHDSDVAPGVTQVFDVTNEPTRLINAGYIEISALSAKEIGLPI